jgi:hypothetical protein
MLCLVYRKQNCNAIASVRLIDIFQIKHTCSCILVGMKKKGSGEKNHPSSFVERSIYMLIFVNNTINC